MTTREETEVSETTTPKLEFGYNQALAGATCAWGARWIITQDGGVDQLWDRHDMIGTSAEKQALLMWLNNRVGQIPQTRLSALLRSGEVSTRERKEVILYEDEHGIVLGNSNASAGYFYVVARFKS